jgi:hypothetical protein
MRVSSERTLRRQVRHRWRCDACGKTGSVLVLNSAGPSKAVRFAAAAHIMRDDCEAMLPKTVVLPGPVIVFSPKGGL